MAAARGDRWLHGNRWRRPSSNGFIPVCRWHARELRADLHVRNLPQAQTDQAYLAANVQAFVNKPLYRPANDAAIEQANVAARELSLMAAEMDVLPTVWHRPISTFSLRDNVRLDLKLKATVTGSAGQTP